MNYSVFSVKAENAAAWVPWRPSLSINNYDNRNFYLQNTIPFKAKSEPCMCVFECKSQTRINSNQIIYCEKCCTHKRSDHPLSPSRTFRRWSDGQKQHSRFNYIVRRRRMKKKSFFFSWITSRYDVRMLSCGARRDAVGCSYSQNKKHFVSHVNAMWVSNGQANWVRCVVVAVVVFHSS